MVASTTATPSGGLPYEIIQKIGEQVKVDSRLSLFSLSSISSHFRKAIMPLIVQDIKVLTQGEPWMVDLENWNKILERASYGSVRRLVIEDNAKVLAGWGDRMWSNVTESPDHLYGEHTGKQTRLRIVGIDEDTETEQESNRKWAPLAIFIWRLKGLQEVTWACADQFPFRIRKMLDEKLPGISLRIDTFAFREPKLGTPNWGSLPNNREMALIQSRNLRSVDVCPNPSTMNIIMRAVAKYSLTLEEVGVYPHKNPVVAPHKTKPTARIASLKHLTIHQKERNFIDLKVLKAWSQTTDFAKLQNLSIEPPIAVGSLGWLTTDVLLPSITRLKLHPLLDGVSQDIHEQAVCDFFDSIPLLEELHLTGTYNSHTLSRILQRHGKTLRRLTVIPESDVLHGVLSTNATKSIMLEACTVLEELTLRVHRSRGDADEVATLRSIGSFPTLQHITLLLNVSEAAQEQERWPLDTQRDKHNGWTHRTTSIIRTGHVCRMLENCAVDETLALSIFHCISKAKPTGSRPLKSLKLQLDGVGKFYGYMYRQSQSHMHHLETTRLADSVIKLVRECFPVVSWLCELRYADGSDDVVVKKVDMLTPELRENHPPAEGISRNVIDALMVVWPAVTRENWHLIRTRQRLCTSLPLQDD